jgi:hypothetical protein
MPCSRKNLAIVKYVNGAGLDYRLSIVSRVYATA